MGIFLRFSFSFSLPLPSEARVSRDQTLAQCRKIPGFSDHRGRDLNHAIEESAGKCRRLYRSPRSFMPEQQRVKLIAKRYVIGTNAVPKAARASAAPF